jgi:hypothetical protein
MVVQLGLGVKLTSSSLFMREASFHIQGTLSLEHLIVDGTRSFGSQEDQCLALVVLFLESVQEFLTRRVIPKEPDGRFGTGPLEMGLAHLTP